MTRLTATKKRVQTRDTTENGVPMVAQSRPLAIPTGGLDAISPVTSMPPSNALQMDNWFPQLRYIEVRRGHVAWCDTMTGGQPVESLMAYNGLLDADDRMFAAVDGNVYDVTTDTPIEEISDQVSDRWQHVNFSITSGNYLYMVNGADPAQHFDGTVWAEPAITGVSSSDLVNVAVYKEQLWFCVNESLNPVYLPVDSLQGAATAFTLSGVFSKGGFLMAIATWSLDGGDGPDDRIAFISSKGEVAVYSGTNPASNFALQGLYTIGAPIGRRCAVKIGGDLAIVCKDGVIPLSKAMITERAAVLSIALTANIQPLINSDVRAFGDNFGWELATYPLGTRAILNVPQLEGETSIQYVINTISGAWARFIGMNANCWCLFKDRIFFGGNDGTVYEADRGGNDNGEAIVATVRGAFTDGGSPMLKLFTLVRPFINADGGDIITPDLAINVDFDETATFNATEAVTPSVALWDDALWDVDEWPAVDRIVRDWQGVEAPAGNFVSVGLQIASNKEGGAAPILQLLAFQIVFTEGGIV